jgi:large subunit ribosomal protein L35
MPKQKTNRSAAKRFKLTGKGKVKRHKAYATHLLGPKSRKRKRQLRKAAIVSAEDHARIKRLIAT